MECIGSTWSRGVEGWGLKKGDRGERRGPRPTLLLPVGVGRARCEMDTPPLSGSDSDSDDSLVTDREVGVSRAGGLGAGEALTPLVLTADLVLQLQDAFSRGLLKPGLNVVLEGPKKAVNDVVSSGARSGVLGREISTGTVVLG